MNEKIMRNVSLDEVQGIEALIVNNHNNKDFNRVNMKIVKTILLPRAMSTFPGQSGISTFFNLFQRIVRDTLRGDKTKVKKQDVDDFSIQFKMLEEDKVIQFHRSNRKIIAGEKLDIDSISLTDVSLNMATQFKQNPINMDDYKITNSLWCLSKANSVDEKERSARFIYLQLILYIVVQAMAEIEDGQVTWSKPPRQTINQVQNWLRTVGKLDKRGRSDLPYGYAADYLDKNEIQSMLSNANLLAFHKDKIELDPLYDILHECFNGMSIKTIEKILQTTELVSQKVDEVIKSEKIDMVQDVELAP
jgi:hypothetical protein